MSWRPELALLFAECISSWARVEGEIAGLLAVLLRAELKVAVAMYYATTSAPARLNMVLAAGNEVLEDGDKTLFQAVIKLASSPAGERNNMIHWTWYIDPKMNDALILAHPKWILDMAAARQIQKNQYKATGVPQEFDFSINNMFIYRQTDFESFIAKAVALINCLALLRFVLDRDLPESIREPSRQKLSNQPDIQEYTRLPAEKNT